MDDCTYELAFFLSSMATPHSCLFRVIGRSKRVICEVKLDRFIGLHVQEHVLIARKILKSTKIIRSLHIVMHRETCQLYLN